MSEGVSAKTFEPLHGVQLLAAGILLALANLIGALDLTIANVSIPTIAAGLGVSPREGTWVVTSYVIAEGIVVPLTGWLALRFGPVRTFVYSMVGFAFTSALCGFSTSLGMLVTFRVLQGLAGGPMAPLSQSLLLGIFPKEKSGMAMGLWAMTAVIGPILGPIFGGQICENWSWPWIFLINIPIALVGALFTWRLLARRDPPPQRLPVDVTGFVLMVGWIGALQIVLDRGQELDWFGSPFIVGLTLFAIIGFAAFLIWELTDPSPIVNLRIFRHRGYSLSVAILCAGFGAFFGSLVITPLWLQTNMGYTSAWAGFIPAPGGITMFVLSPLVAWLSTRIDTRFLVSGGLLLFASVFVWRGYFASNVTFDLIIATQSLTGASVAFFFAPLMALAMGFLEPEEIASGAGLLAFVRTTGVAFATAMATTYWQNSTTSNRVTLVERLHSSDTLDQLAKAGFAPDQAIRYFDDIVQSQAVMLATNDIFFVFACVMAFGAICIWFVPRRQARNLPAAH